MAAWEQLSYHGGIVFFFFFWGGYIYCFFRVLSVFCLNMFVFMFVFVCLFGF